MQPSNLQTFKLGLIGYPLGHSLSPQIHAAALKACGVEGDYSLFPIHPADKQGLRDLLARVRADELHGLNVTIPHKQNVIPLLDELTPTAQAIGAVNTIYRRGKKLIGENTDAAGFLSDLKKVFDFSSFISPPSSLVLGAGGAARAIVYALLKDGWNVTLAVRRIEQAQELAASFPNYQLPITDFSSFILSPSSFILHPSSFPLHPSSLSFQPANLPTFNLLVNATPLGMTPNANQSPLPENFRLPANAFVYDLVYNPRETKLVKDARAQGLKAATGLGMLTEQAALAFEIWTGCRPLTLPTDH